MDIKSPEASLTTMLFTSSHSNQDKNYERSFIVFSEEIAIRGKWKQSVETNNSYRLYSVYDEAYIHYDSILLAS